MTLPQFGPVTLEAIAHGSLEKKLNERLADTAKRLADYVTSGGVDLTKGATAEVTLKIKLKHVEAGIFTVKGDVADKAPVTPLPATDRLILDETGQLLINLAPEVGADDDPRQLTLDRQDRKKEI